MGADEHQQFRVVAAVCQLLAIALWIPLVGTGQNPPELLGIAYLLLPAPFGVYLWLRLDGKTSPFAVLTFVLLTWRIVEFLWVLLIQGAFPLDPSVVAWDVTYLALVRVAWYWLLFRRGHDDPALPRLYATFWAVVIYAIAVAVATYASDAVLLALASWVSLGGAIWLLVWAGMVSWRLIKESRAVPSR